LKTDEPEVLEELWQRADEVRSNNVGDEVHLRGLIEFSNYCSRSCAYCGIFAGNKNVQRYRLSLEEILESADVAKSFGYGTVVLQSGEDKGVSVEFVTEAIRKVKENTGLAITLSVGEYGEDILREWKSAGADRFLLRFETSNEDLYCKIHPDAKGGLQQRLQVLKDLKKLRYEVGSGVLIGVPSQTYNDLANDLLMFVELGLDMVGVGPYLPHPETLLGKGKLGLKDAGLEQVQPNELMAYKVVALVRLLLPKANIPSTTAVATLNDKGRELGLMRGANVIMPNVTPLKYRSMYEIYPAKACKAELPEHFDTQLKKRIYNIGRIPGKGRGDSAVFIERNSSV
jgi:biotin synthase